MGIISSAINSAQQAGAVARQERFQERTFKNRYQWQMQDMRKAGLNPILAFGQSPPPGPSGAMAAKGVDVSDTPVTDAKRAREQLRLLEAQTDKTRAEADITQAEVPFKNLEEDLKREVADEIRGLATEAQDAWGSAKGAWKGVMKWFGGDDRMKEETSGKEASGKGKTIAPRLPRTYEEALESRERRKHTRHKSQSTIDRHGRRITTRDAKAWREEMEWRRSKRKKTGQQW